MIKVVLFDVDGVIANGEGWHVYLERDHGITTEQLSPFFAEKFTSCLLGVADLKDALASYLPQWGWQQSTDAFLDYWFTCEHVVDQPLIDYVQSLRQRGLPCYLATQQEKYRTRYIASEMGLARSFDGIFSSANLGYLKSEPDFFAAIMRHLPAIDTSEVLFWDDTARNVQVARASGLHAELYTDFASFCHTMDTYKL